MDEDAYAYLGCCEVCFPEIADEVVFSEDDIADGHGRDLARDVRPAMMVTPAAAVGPTLSEAPRVGGSLHPVLPSALVTVSEDWSKDDVLVYQDNDPIIRQVKDRLRDDEPFGRQEMRSADFRPYRKLWSVLFLDDSGLLVRMIKYLPLDEQAYVPIIPQELRRPLLYRCHDLGGHFGRHHMWERMRRLCFWPGMNVDITDYVAQCARCLTSKARQKPAAAFVPFPVGRPWHTVAVDFLFIGPSDSGPTKLLVVVDHFTRWADAFVVKGEGAADALEPLLQLFSQFGPPTRLLSDQGSAFESQVFADAMKILGVAKARSTPHHPNSNGYVERFNSTILNLLRAYTQRVGDWQGHLRPVLWQYNTCPHSSTGFSPYYLMFGREPPQTLLPSLSQFSSLMYDPDGYAEYLARARATIADVVDEWVTAGGAPHRRAMEQERSRQRLYVGQRVRVKLFRSGREPGYKLLPKWQPDWYIMKFIQGVNNKTVVLRHFPDLSEKVIISTDFLLADPVQPHVVPPQLGVVRMDPPVEEAPSAPSFPFRRLGDEVPEDVFTPPQGRDYVSAREAETVVLSSPIPVPLVPDATLGWRLHGVEVRPGPVQREMAPQMLVDDEVAHVRSPDSQDSGVQRNEMLAPEIPEVPEMEEAADDEPLSVPSRASSDRPSLVQSPASSEAVVDPPSADRDISLLPAPLTRTPASDASMEVHREENSEADDLSSLHDLFATPEGSSARSAATPLAEGSARSEGSDHPSPVVAADDPGDHQDVAADSQPQGPSQPEVAPSHVSRSGRTVRPPRRYSPGAYTSQGGLK